MLCLFFSHLSLYISIKTLSYVSITSCKMLQRMLSDLQIFLSIFLSQFARLDSCSYIQVFQFYLYFFVQQAGLWFVREIKLPSQRQ